MKRKIAAVLLGGCVMASLMTGCGIDKKDLAGDGQTSQIQNTQNEQAGQDIQNEQDGQTSQTQDAQNDQTSQAPQNGQGITQEQAKEIALSQAGVAEADAIALAVHQDFDDGFQLWEVDIYTSDADYEYQINAADGSVLERDVEQAYKTDNITSQTSVTPDAARKAVLAKVPGASDKNLRMKLDMDDGRYAYEGEVIYNNTEYEFEMDAQSGNIYKWEQKALQY